MTHKRKRRRNQYQTQISSCRTTSYALVILGTNSKIFVQLHTIPSFLSSKKKTCFPSISDALIGFYPAFVREGGFLEAFRLLIQINEFSWWLNQVYKQTASVLSCQLSIRNFPTTHNNLCRSVHPRECVVRKKRRATNKSPRASWGTNVMARVDSKKRVTAVQKGPLVYVCSQSVGLCCSQVVRKQNFLLFYYSMRHGAELHLSLLSFPTKWCISLLLF